MSKQLTERQLQIARRRRVRALETRRDQELLKRDRASEVLRGIRAELKAARLR